MDYNIFNIKFPNLQTSSLPHRRIDNTLPFLRPANIRSIQMFEQRPLWPTGPFQKPMEVFLPLGIFRTLLVSPPALEIQEVFLCPLNRRGELAVSH